MNAATKGADEDAPEPVASRYSVPRREMKSSGSNSSPAAGVTALITLGSASDWNASPTPCQMESRVRGSAVTIDSSESAHPSAARVEPCRMRTASIAEVGESAH